MTNKFEQPKIVTPSDEEVKNIEKNLDLNSDKNKKSLSDKNQEKINKIWAEEEKPLSASEKNQEEIERVWKKEEEEEERTEAKPEIQTESKELNQILVERFKYELNIKKEDLEGIEGFKDLSLGQQLLILENLKQVSLGEVKEEAKAKYDKEISQSGFLGRIRKAMIKNYKILKLEKATAKEIKEGGIEFHKESIGQMIKGIKEFGTEVEMKGGHLEIKYAAGFENLTPEEQRKVNVFNEAATEFSRIPDEWSKDTAAKEERKKYKLGKEKFEEAKQYILELRFEKEGEKKALLYMNTVENNIKLNQLLNAHPEFEDQLERIENEKVWKRALKSVITEKGIYAGAGFLTRTATVSLIGAIGAPLAAAGMGSFLSRKRAKETLKEKDIMARKGKEDASRTAKDFADAEYLHESIDFLINELQKESLTQEKKEEMLRSLKFHIEEAREKIEDGTVNYGKKDKRIFNQYELIKQISLGAVMAEFNGVNNEKYQEDIEKITEVVKRQKKKTARARKAYISKQMINGFITGAGFAAAGYAFRHFGESLGWWEDQVKLSEKKTPQDQPEIIRKKIPENEVLETVAKEGKEVNFWEAKVAEKGDSSLSLAKEMYLEHAKELGYKEEMGDIKKWAERFSTRHIVGQYISEHQDDYKELIGKIGVPPENPAEMDKWISKVPAKTFNEVLNNKVPNLIHVGDTVSISQNGDINAYSSKGELRIGRLIAEQKGILTAESFKSVMEANNFSELSSEQVKKIDKIFSKHLAASFEGFKNFSPEEQQEKLKELDQVLHDLAFKFTANQTEDEFVKQQIEEINMIKEIWGKFGEETIPEKDLPEPALKKETITESAPIPDETGSDLKGETLVGSESNIKEIEELFKKKGMEKVIEQVRAGKITREDFKEFLFEDARKSDNFIDDKERKNINLIMKMLDSKK